MDRSGYAQRLKMQKDAGANFIRLTTHQSSPEMYDLCNEMGMMIWQEMPLQWAYSTSEPIHRDILQIARETMVQTRPHPSVIGYSAWNEGRPARFHRPRRRTDARIWIPPGRCPALAAAAIGTSTFTPTCRRRSPG